MKNPGPFIKVKVGVEGDIEMVAALRKHTNAVLRVDANAGWTLGRPNRKFPY